MLSSSVKSRSEEKIPEPDEQSDIQHVLVRYISVTDNEKDVAVNYKGRSDTFKTSVYDLIGERFVQGI